MTETRTFYTKVAVLVFNLIPTCFIFQTITEIYETTTTRTSDYDQSETSTPALAQPQPAKPVERKKVIRKKVDTSKFMTPYIEHSQKMQGLFSPVSLKALPPMPVV